jgi:hypothetical protein
MYINIFNNIRMNKNSKLLPHLNQLFLQRQSYTSHKRKMIEIRRKRPKSTIQEELSLLHSRRSFSSVSPKISEKHHSINRMDNGSRGEEIPPIIYECNRIVNNTMNWMSPYDRIKKQ